MKEKIPSRFLLISVSLGAVIEIRDKTAFV